MDGEFNGNKARKLEYFLHAGLGSIKRVVSYGSSQSNAMYSLSVFAKMKGLEFHYVVSNLNSNLAANPIGNFKFALENGMKIYIDKDRRAQAKALAYELAGLKESEIYGDDAVNLTDASDRNGLSLKDTGGSNLSTARSFSRSTPITFALYWLPSESDTNIFVASSITCVLVRM